MKKFRFILPVSLLALVFTAACSPEDPADPDVEENEQEPEEELTEPSDEAIEGQDVQDLYLYMDNTDVSELYSRDVNSDDRLDGHMKLDPDDDEIIELDGLRFRGNTARGLDKKSFNIRFEDDQDFLFGSNRMNLNAMYRDPSMMREKISWDMFAELDHPAPRAEYFNLYINDVFEGLYVHIERIDQDLLANHDLNEEGTLVRDDMRGHYNGDTIDVYSSFGFDITRADDQPHFLEEIFRYRGNPHWGELTSLIEWVYQTPAGPEFAEKFQEEMNVDRFIDWLAVHFLIGDIDAFGDDYWLYLDHEDPDAKWEVIPWDKNLTFGSHTRSDYGVLNDYFAYEYPMDVGSWDNHLFMKLLETPELKEKLDERLVQLMGDVFTYDYFEEKFHTYQDRIYDSVMVDPSDRGAFDLHPQNHFGELGDYEYRSEAILDFIELRYQYIKAQIGALDTEGTLTATETIDDDTEGPVYFTDDQGWVISKFEPTNVVNEGDITFSVEENQEIDGVNRTFSVNAGDAEVEGTLTIYYRNDLGWPAGGNWYKENTAIGEQWDLTLAEYDGSTATPLDSTINPYTNKLTIDTSLTGENQYVITH
ncbi:CotH kinase family protein [Texcoconibacillus texcoconensis]|uniref:Spore coat protein H n=1 Tax=Texcoconibacillus texcoconensis TaxID=1095777 RepID=A0A840QR17_9BACI|nr:CotH kinase family protein [Texcoconibacillus texcoconensis]MBB5173778.1 spore coat protein H [Texcoconibacillus texcoconensis]